MEQLIEIVSKILLIDKPLIHDNMSRKNVEEWDSLSHLMLISEIESAFKITMSDDAIMSMQTIGDLKKILKESGVLS
jgi:acyl carrier protein